MSYSCTGQYQTIPSSACPFYLMIFHENWQLPKPAYDRLRDVMSQRRILSEFWLFMETYLFIFKD